MSLKTTLALLALLAVLSALIGTAAHYLATQAAFSSEADRAADARVELLNNRLEMFLSEQLRPVAALAGLEPIENALATGDPDALGEANLLLDHFNAAMEADVCYLMDGHGITVASSNRAAADSFVGMDFAFRPYFQEAVHGQPFTYMALGAASARRGVYFSHPVYAGASGEPVGVAVIKAPVDAIEAHLTGQDDVVVLLVDPHGIVFISSEPDWLLHSLWSLSPNDQSEIAATRQFGTGPWGWVGVRELDERRVVGPDGSELLIHRRPIRRFPGWQLTMLADGSYGYFGHLRLSWISSRWMVIPLFIGICATVALLYHRANTEIIRRRVAQASLRANEERFRTLYHKTPAMLHSVDASMRILRVSAYWTDTMGYAADEVIGRRITDLMTSESREHAEREVIPEFMRTGTIRDAAYRFRRKNGEPIDVLLSAISELDADGRVERSLAVMVDITEQKRTERRLKIAQEELHSYSQDLERLVRTRTREITDILRYSPAVVSLKDLDGRYLLVNPRFEELFGVDGNTVRGRTGEDVLAPETARLLCAHDAEVIATGRSLGVEEKFSAARSAPTYYSVKFPLYDDQERMNGVGSISTEVTELKHAQEMLRRLPARIVEEQEKERAAVARELHDELGQSLTAIKLDAAWLGQRLAGTDLLAIERADEMCAAIDRTLDEVRGMVNRLRPGVLDDLGLVPALEWLVDDFEKHTGITCTSRVTHLPPLEDAECKAIYRITQEALTNVARHSGATGARVELATVTGEGLRLTVVDDGRGFTPAAVNGADGRHGLAGIHERAELIGGSVGFATNRDGGTTVSLWLPIDQARWAVQ